ncbi:GNAT family N-acetyltransferase [Lacinutrix neustonica]|uniref:GNAT family N-acetyltransferase n=1 Tax=Lacinutrix neustonica TaxID=2980107 RepID=A0A9E8MUR7_9FLAO|nr:GNAT family N-acetyltransferase [Lacinutrix neustonica]WAC01868.1 GNAT family N-acetyltransferase [Lacinutrix neustonica]
MLKIVRTDANNPDFIALITSLDNYLKITDGDEHAFYNQFNAIAVIKHVVVGYLNGIPVACGAFKSSNTTTIEIKRMFTKPDVRGKGIASGILTALEIWAKELGYTSAILETGTRQVEAVSFYKKCGYRVIANYGQYKNMEHSVCYKKEIDEKTL